LHKSTDRILTTHAGSIPRGDPLGEMLIDEEAGKPVDTSALQANVELRVSHVLEKQAEAGVDIVNDGEQGRVGFQTYITQRMSGFGGVSKRPYGKEFIEYPQFTKRMMERLAKISKVFDAPEAIADIKYRDTALINAEIERLTRLSAAVKPRVTEFFMNAPSPGIVATTMLNAHYASHEAYLDAVAGEIRTEYLAVTKAGFVLQIDAPDLAMERHRFFNGLNDADFLRQLELHVAAINLGIEGIPRDRIRLHVCWGNNDGPHIYDIAMAAILPALYRANVGALSIEFANPRHQHEYQALRTNPLPAHMLLMPGVLDTTTNFVEHPELVARRLTEAVSLVADRERVIAGTDCGFGTFAGREYVAEEIVWVKLAAAAEGARIASRRLWGGAGT